MEPSPFSFARLSMLSSPTVGGMVSAVAHGIALAALAGWAMNDEPVRFAGTPHVVSVSLASAPAQSEAETSFSAMAPIDAPPTIEPRPAELQSRLLAEAPSAKSSTAVDIERRPHDIQLTPIAAATPWQIERRDRKEVSPQMPAMSRTAAPARTAHRQAPATTLTASTSQLSATSAPDSSSSLGNDPLIAPSFVGNSPPNYPEQARRMGWQGTVLLRLTVAIDGRITRMEIAESSGFEILDAEAVRAVQSWRGRPASRGGRPIKTVELLPVVFRLRG